MSLRPMLHIGPAEALMKLRDEGGDALADAAIAGLHEEYDDYDHEELAEYADELRVALVAGKTRTETFNAAAVVALLAGGHAQVRQALMDDWKWDVFDWLSNVADEPALGHLAGVLVEGSVGELEQDEEAHGYAGWLTAEQVRAALPGLEQLIDTLEPDDELADFATQLLEQAVGPAADEGAGLIVLADALPELDEDGGIWISPP